MVRIAEDHALAAGVAQCAVFGGLAGIMQMPPARSLRLVTSVIFDVVRSSFGSAKGLQDVDLNSDGLTAAVRASQAVTESWARLTTDNVEALAILLRRRSAPFLLNIMLSRSLLEVRRSTSLYLTLLPT